MNTFLEKIIHLPGRYKIPFKYLCKNHANPHPTTNHYFIDYCMEMTPLKGDTFVIDSSKLHTFIVNFIYKNDAVNDMINSLEDENNGRLNMFDLQEHYKSVGVWDLDVTKEEETLKTCYIQERRNHTHGGKKLNKTHCSFCCMHQT